MSKYIVISGKFPCHTCKKEVTSLRCYGEDQLLSWMCEDKHLTNVSLKSKRKKDYEREK